jgi:hypothetical protein
MEERRQIEPERRATIGVWTTMGIVSTVFWVVGTVGLVTWTNWDNLQQQRFLCPDMHWTEVADSASASWAHPSRRFRQNSCESIRINFRDDDGSFFLLILLAPPTLAWLSALGVAQAFRWAHRTHSRLTQSENKQHD